MARSLCEEKPPIWREEREQAALHMLCKIPNPNSLSSTAVSLLHPVSNPAHAKHSAPSRPSIPTVA